MKLIDRYIVRQFLTTTLFALFAVTLVFIVIDAMEKGATVFTENGCLIAVKASP